MGLSINQAEVNTGRGGPAGLQSCRRHTACTPKPAAGAGLLFSRKPVTWIFSGGCGSRWQVSWEQKPEQRQNSTTKPSSPGLPRSSLHIPQHPLSIAWFPQSVGLLCFAPDSPADPPGAWLPPRGTEQWSRLKSHGSADSETHPVVNLPSLCQAQGALHQH